MAAVTVNTVNRSIVIVPDIVVFSPVEAVADAAFLKTYAHHIVGNVLL